MTTILSSVARQAAIDDWEAAVHHRFVAELGAGSIEDAVMRRYLVQDYQFCDAFVAALGQACASAPTLSSRLRYARQLGFFAADENNYFNDAFDELGVTEADRQQPKLHSATRAFDALMREVTASRSYPQVVALLLVAEWLYADWAATIADRPTRPLHRDWVTIHDTADFRAWVGWLRSELDSTVLPTEPNQAEVIDVFKRASSCERAFFDAAYDSAG